MKEGVWQKGKRKITGVWCYLWHSRRFKIILDSRDPVTGRQREFEVGDESPEFNGWKLLEKRS